MSSQRNYFCDLLTLTKVGGPQEFHLRCGDEIETQIDHVGSNWEEITYDEVNQCLKGGQGQVSRPRG